MRLAMKLDDEWGINMAQLLGSMEGSRTKWTRVWALASHPSLEQESLLPE
jgi:hypothetical protein